MDLYKKLRYGHILINFPLIMIGIDSMKRDNVTSPDKSSVSSGCLSVWWHIAFHEEKSKSLILCASKMMNLEQQKRCSLTAKGKSMEMLLAWH